MHVALSITLALFIGGSTVNRLPEAPPAAPPSTTTKLLPPSKDGPRVQLALLLDTSSSMSGLIDQARTQLWKVAGELARSNKDGRIPLIEVALYEYGNSGLSAEDGFIRQVSRFTDDLDLVSERLFALRSATQKKEAVARESGGLLLLAWVTGACVMQGPREIRPA